MTATSERAVVLSAPNPLSDVIFMVDGTSFMGLGGPNLVKGATGQTIDAETLGGSRTHTGISAVAHYRAANDRECVEKIRAYVARLPRVPGLQHARQPSLPPRRDPAELYDLLPHDHRMSYDVHKVLECLLDEGKLEEFQPEHLGKLEFYLEALDRNVRKPHERPSIGVLLCATRDREVVEYALSRAMSPALVAEYQTHLPDRSLLQAKLHEFYELATQQSGMPGLPGPQQTIKQQRNPRHRSRRK